MIQVGDPNPNENKRPDRKLKEFPEDMEVVIDTDGMLYEREIDLEVVTATAHPAELIKPNEYTLYHK